MPVWTAAVEYVLESAHFLPGYDGPCANVHGHSYRVRVEATSDTLRQSEHCPIAAFVCDFHTLRWAAHSAGDGGLDHCVLNERLPEGLIPTAENVAQFILEETQRRIGNGIQLSVTVWESADSWVTCHA